MPGMGTQCFLCFPHFLCKHPFHHFDLRRAASLDRIFNDAWHMTLCPTSCLQQRPRFICQSRAHMFVIRRCLNKRGGAGFGPSQATGSPMIPKQRPACDASSSSHCKGLPNRGVYAWVCACLFVCLCVCVIWLVLGLPEIRTPTTKGT